MASAPGSEKTLPSRFKFILPLLGVLGGVFFLSEVFLRVLRFPALQYYRDVKILHVYHPSYWVGLAPGIDLSIRHYQGLWEGRFRTNSLGYRGSAEPDPARPQLACLGDSIVMGFGVSDRDTFCRRLDGIRLGGVSYQAMNLGVDAFGSMGSARRLEEGLKKLPNLKIALFIVSPNDFTMAPDLRARGVLPDDDKELLREKNPNTRFWFRLQFELTRASYVLHALKLSQAQLRIRGALTRVAVKREFQEMSLLSVSPGEASALPGDSCARLPRAKRPFCYLRTSFFRERPAPSCASKNGSASGASRLSPEEREASRRASCRPAAPAREICRSAPTPGKDLPELPASTIRAYKKLIAIARKRGVTLIPTLLPIQSNVLRCAQRGLYSPEFDYALRAKREFERRGFQVMDLRPYIKKMCGESISMPDGGTRYSTYHDYFIPGDGHFTVRGNRWASRALARELEKRIR